MSLFDEPNFLEEPYNPPGAQEKKKKARLYSEDDYMLKAYEIVNQHVRDIVT